MEDKKIVSIEDRIPKLKQQRKKKANRRLIFYLSLFFVLICLIIYLQSPLSYVRNIEVIGNNYRTKDEVIKRSELTNETNIWKVKKTEIEESLLKDPVVKSVHISRKLPWTISLQLKEHELVGYVKEEENFKPLLENGAQIEAIDRYTYGDAPLLLNFEDKKLLKEMTTQLQQLPPYILRLISEIHAVPEKDDQSKILLYMIDGFIVDGTIRNFGEKMQVYPSIVSQLEQDSKGIIHIGVGAYFEQFNENKNNEQSEVTEDEVNE